VRNYHEEGQTIHVQLSTKEGKPHPIGNILLLIHFFTGGTYRYGFEAGRTDDTGQLTLSYDDVEKRRRTSAQEFLMDYNTKLEDCDAVVKIIVPSEQELLSRKQKDVENYGRIPDWAATWPSNARINAQEERVELVGQTVVVRICAN
jgi:hypothetical protein